MQINKDLIFDIMPTGEIRFNRQDKDDNDATLDVLISLLDDESKVKEIKNFFDDAQYIQPILGDDRLCG